MPHKKSSKHSLTELFCGVFRKQGFTVSPYEALEMVGFENKFITGSVLFRPKTKRHVIRWKCKEGYRLLDIPFAESGVWVQTDFHSAGDLLNFLQRCLVWKKQYN